MKLHHLAAVAALAVTNAHAGQQTTTMNVTAEIIEACSLSANDMNFGSGTHNHVKTKATTTQINVNCPSTISWTVSLDGGLHTGEVLTSNFTFGHMMRELHHSQGGRYGFGVFGYSIYHDTTNGTAPTTTTYWGDGDVTARGAPVSGSGQSTLTAIGKIDFSFANHSNGGNPAGLYSDIVTVTLDY